MTKAVWALACIAAGAALAAGSYSLFRAVVYRSLPNVDGMEVACGVEGASRTAAPLPFSPTAAQCEKYFSEAASLTDPASTQSVITGALTAFILLVWRFRIRPLDGASRSAPGALARAARDPAAGT